MEAWHLKDKSNRKITVPLSVACSNDTNQLPVFEHWVNLVPPRLIVPSDSTDLSK